ncbi:UNVERIFIED_CONTAM: hypothetical protein Sradi_3589400 [Sesamum radiatum]|uniref:RNase H type-1 domain-containing protein n=1 Tax=Sesamum radiatum TaxID=300843 RepID=A0AAW2QGR0_SESRA
MTTSVIAELTAVWCGLELALAHGLAPIVVEVAATTVIYYSLTLPGSGSATFDHAYHTDPAGARVGCSAYFQRGE